MLRKPGEYLWSPSRRQLAEERAGKGWKLQQIQPERVQLNIAPTMTQVVEISQGVHVAYPVEWLCAQIKPEYVTVTLLIGSVVRYCQDTMEREVQDTTWGGVTSGCIQSRSRVTQAMRRALKKKGQRGTSSYKPPLFLFFLTFRGGKGEETNARTPPGHRPLSSLTLS